MKTFIILDGPNEGEKRNWLKKEGLENFLVRLSDIKTLFSKPELVDGRDVLSSSRNESVLELLFRILCYRMDMGTLVVLDMGDLDYIPSIDDLILIYGYTKFTRSFIDPSSGIKSMADIKKYYDDLGKFKIKLGKKDPIVYVSDIHSNWTLYQKLSREFPKDTKLTVFLGDYIDGPEKGGSKKILDYLIDRHKNDPSIVVLEGNHELRLRKFLGYNWVKGNRKALGKVLKEMLSIEFLNDTANDFIEFKDDPYLSRLYLENLNSIFQETLEITKGDITIICTHAGFSNLRQLTPEYIGTVMYGTKFVEATDKKFSASIHKEKGLWSVHAHCHYQKDPLDHFRYYGVINLDPRSNSEVLCYIDKYNKVVSQHT